MPESVKELHSSAIESQTTGTLISNNATTKQLVKTMVVCNTTDAPNTFDINLAGVALYSKVDIAARESIKFQEENLLVKESTALTLVNSGSTFPVEFSTDIIEHAESSVVNVITDSVTGDIYIFFINQGVSSQLWYTVLDKNGATLKIPTVLVAQVMGLTIPIELTETKAYITGAAQGASINAQWFRIAKNSLNLSVSQISTTAFTMHTIERFMLNGLPDVNDYWAARHPTGGRLWGDASGETTVPTEIAITEAATHNVQDLSLAGLSNNEMLIAWYDNDNNRDGWFLKKDTVNATVGSMTRWFTGAGGSGVLITGVRALSNGTFAILYQEQVDNNKKIAIYNNDLTINVAAANVTNPIGSSYLNGNDSLQVDSNDNIYIIYTRVVAPVAATRTWVDKYNSAGTLQYSNRSLNKLDSNDQLGFRAHMNGNGDVFGVFEPKLRTAALSNEIRVSKFLADSSLDVTLSGVEVTP